MPEQPLPNARQNDKPAPRPRRRPWPVVILFAFWAFCFKSTVTALLVGLLTWLTYELFFRGNRRLILLAVSSILSWAAFEYVGGLILTSRHARYFERTGDHRMLPNSGPGINQDGIRCEFEADDFTQHTFNIIFLGDSFTYGTGLENGADPFPQQVEAILAERNLEPPVRSINFAWPSSSPLLSLRFLQDIGASYKPDLVILNVDMTDFRDDLGYRAAMRPLRISPTVFLLRKLDLEWILIGMHRVSRLPQLWRKLFAGPSVDRFFIVNQPLVQSRPFMGEIERNIRAVADYCRNTLHCRFILILLPRHIQYSDRECPRNWERHMYTALGPYVYEPFKWLDTFARTVDFPCYSLLEAFQQTTVFPTCFAKDPHWNQAGHRVAAEAIVRILERERCVAPAPDPHD